jgi:hypothetical protein
MAKSSGTKCWGPRALWFTSGMPATTLLPFALALVTHAVSAAPALLDPAAPPGRAAAPSRPTVWILEEARHHERPQQGHLQLGVWLSQLSLALGYAIPLSEDGLLPNLNDSFDVEFGGNFVYNRGYFWNSPAASSLALGGGVRWNFYLTQAWTAFSTLKLNFEFGVRNADPFFFYPAFTVGGLYRLGKGTQLRLEAGNPMGVGLGLSFDL